MVDIAGSIPATRHRDSGLVTSRADEASYASPGFFTRFLSITRSICPGPK
jgi:hypothetical protein